MAPGYLLIISVKTRLESSSIQVSLPSVLMAHVWGVMPENLFHYSFTCLLRNIHFQLKILYRNSAEQNWTNFTVWRKCMMHNNHFYTAMMTWNFIFASPPVRLLRVLSYQNMKFAHLFAQCTSTLRVEHD